jgi:hypothetical protein
MMATTLIAPVDGSSPARPGTGSPPTKLMEMSGQTQIVLPPPDYNTAIGAGGVYKARRRSAKLGLRPKIIIFSDKKDLIRVTLDSDEDSDEDITHFKYSHKHHARGKSAKRRSIAGDFINVTSSR